MLIPLKQFVCDTCGQVIENPNEGWVEWLSSFDEDLQRIQKKEFRICHHNIKCQKHANKLACADLPLTEFHGEMGMIKLISFLDIGIYHDKDWKGSNVHNIREYAELLRRFTLPYYEEARQYWEEATNDGYLEDGNELTIYKTDFLKRLITEYNSK